MTIHTFPLHIANPKVAIRRELDRMFDDVFVNRAGSPEQPTANAREDATGYSLEIDLPGVAPETIEVLAEDGVLSIKGARPPRELADGERLLFTEAGRGPFERRFRLPKSADLQAVSASYGLGVLTVRVSKITPAQPRKVTVTIQG